MQIPGLQIAPDAEGLTALPWRATRYQGIEWLDLVALQRDQQNGQQKDQSSDQRDSAGSSPSQTVLIRMAPGCGYPRHRHIGPEDVLVLAGGYRDDDGRTFEVGQFVRYPKGSEHTPVALGTASGSSEACILYAVAHEGTELSEPSVPPSA